jgi:hypothetical protein
MENPMKRILTASMLVAVAAFATAPAFAATTTKATTSTMAAAKPAVAKSATTKPTVLSFKLIDANHDGKISYDELKKYFPKLTKAEFAKYAGKDGTLDHAGLAAFFKAQKAADAAAAKPATSTKTATKTK